jgi:hypothetical protein
MNDMADKYAKSRDIIDNIMDAYSNQNLHSFPTSLDSRIEEWHINNEFDKKLERQESTGKLEKDPYELGYPSLILQGCNISANYPIEMLSGDLEHGTSKKHSYPILLLKGLPSKLNRPMMVFDSTRKDGSKVIFPDIIDGNGSQFMITLKEFAAAPEWGKKAVNGLTNVYPKNNPMGIVRWINQDFMLYGDKKRVLDFLNGLKENVEKEIESQKNISEIEVSNEDTSKRRKRLRIKPSPDWDGQTNTKTFSDAKVQNISETPIENLRKIEDAIEKVNNFVNSEVKDENNMLSSPNVVTYSDVDNVESFC